MSVLNRRKYILLVKICLIFLLVSCYVLYVRGQLIDDEEDESSEDETSEEKATRKSIKEDSYLTVLTNSDTQVLESETIEPKSDQPILIPAGSQENCVLSFGQTLGAKVDPVKNPRKRKRERRKEGDSQNDQLITKYGYQAEIHHVTTDDGYILTMHRIRKQGAQPFFLQHGLVDSSAGYVIMGPNVSLAYLLSDYNYDVWLGNARGNRYSRNHTTLDPDEKKFWDFSWHEIGIYDLPAMIDYVLKTTGFKRIQYAGHSQGCTAFFVMCSMKPEYNKKVIMMQAMAPAVYASETDEHPYIRAINIYFNSLVGSSVTEMFNGEFRFLCRMTDETERLCIEAIFGIVGRNWAEFNRQMFPIILGHYPAGVASKQVKHFIQVIKSGRFSPYSYSTNKNLALYHEHIPPRYNLSLVTVPTYVYYSTNDLLCHPEDVEEMFKDLGRPLGKYLIPMKEFNHMDFLWAINVRKLVYTRMLQVLGKIKIKKPAKDTASSSANVTANKKDNNSGTIRTNIPK